MTANKQAEQAHGEQRTIRSEPEMTFSHALQLTGSAVAELGVVRMEPSNRVPERSAIAAVPLVFVNP